MHSTWSSQVSDIIEDFTECEGPSEKPLTVITWKTFLQKHSVKIFVSA